MFRQDGQTKRTVELLEHVVVIRKRTPDEAHRDRLASGNKLARAYLADGQTKRAVNCES